MLNETIPVYNATEECSKCKGKCCKNMGCHFSPSDFSEISFEFLKAEIEKGCISIDWWEGDCGPEYFLRMRHKSAPIVDPSWGGECILLTDTGCPLPFERRPLGGRALKPRDNENCNCTTTGYSKEDCKNEWKPYSSILSELIDCFED